MSGWHHVDLTFIFQDQCDPSLLVTTSFRLFKREKRKYGYSSLAGVYFRRGKTGKEMSSCNSNFEKFDHGQHMVRGQKKNKEWAFGFCNNACLGMKKDQIGGLGSNPTVSFSVLGSTNELKQRTPPPCFTVGNKHYLRYRSKKTHGNRETAELAKALNEERETLLIVVVNGNHYEVVIYLVDGLKVSVGQTARFPWKGVDYLQVPPIFAAKP